MLQKLREKLPRPTLPRWDGQLAPLGWLAAAFGCGVLFGGAELFGALHPLGLALVYGVQHGLVCGAAAGAMLGYLLLLPTVEALRYLGAVAAALAGRLLMKQRFWPAAVAGTGCLLLVQLMLSVSGAGSLADALGALGDAALALAAGAALDQRRKGSSGVRMAGLSGLMMLTAALQRFANGIFQPGLILFGVLGLVLARRGHLKQTAVLCVALSAALMAAAPEFACGAVGLSAGCLLAALAGGESITAGALFLAGCLPGLLAAPDAVTALYFAGSALLARGIAWLLPKSILAAMEGAVPPEAGCKPMLAGAAGRLSVVGDALTDIAQTVNAVCEKLPPRGEDFNWVVEQTAEELCRSCARCRECWIRDYTTTQDGFYHLKTVLEQQGRIGVEQLPGQLCRCIHPAELCGAVSRSWTLYKGRQQAREQGCMLRAAVTEQYSAVAGALTQLAEDLGRASSLDAARSTRVADLFAGMGLEPLEAAVTVDALGRMETRVTVNRTGFTEEEQQQLTWEIGRICRRSFALPEVNHCRTVTLLAFREHPVYCPVFGRISIPACPGQLCGDASDAFCDSFGKAHLLVCDGMGTGKSAAVDGRLAASLMAKLLRAGFDGEAAARLVNVALTLKGDEETSATVDLLTVDLYTGRARLYKAGAAPSFLVRAGQVRLLEGSSLPVGILAKVTGACTPLTLQPGDWVVLMSDGALADGEEWVMQQLHLSMQTGDDPGHAARLLADQARRRAPGGQQDDITVAIFKLEHTR